MNRIEIRLTDEELAALFGDAGWDAQQAPKGAAAAEIGWRSLVARGLARFPGKAQEPEISSELWSILQAVQNHVSVLDLMAIKDQELATGRVFVAADDAIILEQPVAPGITSLSLAAQSDLGELVTAALASQEIGPSVPDRKRLGPAGTSVIEEAADDGPLVVKSIQVSKAADDDMADRFTWLEADSGPWELEASGTDSVVAEPTSGPAILARIGTIIRECTVSG